MEKGLPRFNCAPANQRVACIVAMKKYAAQPHLTCTYYTLSDFQDTVLVNRVHTQTLRVHLDAAFVGNNKLREPLDGGGACVAKGDEEKILMVVGVEFPESYVFE